MTYKQAHKTFHPQTHNPHKSWTTGIQHLHGKKTSTIIDFAGRRRGKCHDTTRKNCDRINTKSLVVAIVRLIWPGHWSTEDFDQFLLIWSTKKNHCPNFLGKNIFYCAGFWAKKLTFGLPGFYGTLTLPVYTCKARLAQRSWARAKRFEPPTLCFPLRELNR